MHEFCRFADRILGEFVSERPDLKSALILQVWSLFLGRSHDSDGNPAGRRKVQISGAIIRRIKALSGGGWFCAVL